ncbi:MAG TPA: class I SAM-dependent methyltransferase [Ktedonosporobacter sp.]|nr:class I SAM-dependent methyltransferase [Ktedonosporobacter sp.]
MNDYDIIAPFYDIEHAHFSEDLDMYRNFAELCGGKILELACGSGRVLLPLAQEGFELTGIDTSEAMLLLAQQRLQQAGVAERCTLVQQDLSSMHLEQKFRMAFIALGSFAHITSRKAQQQALAAVRAHLSPGGLFIVDISNSDARYMEDLSGQVLHQGTWRTDDGSFVTHFVSPAASSEQHLLELTHFYDQHRQGGTVQRTVVTTHLYLFDRNEIELLLEQAGFVVKDVYGDHDLGPYQLESPRLICIAEAR